MNVIIQVGNFMMEGDQFVQVKVSQMSLNVLR